jgi:hypothetical protein
MRHGGETFLFVTETDFSVLETELFVTKTNLSALVTDLSAPNARNFPFLRRTKVFQNPRVTRD